MGNFTPASMPPDNGAEKGWSDEHACGVQEALVLAASAHGQSSKVGVYVGCMWAHEFVEVLPGLVGTPPPSCCLPRRILHSHFSRAMPHLEPFQHSADEQNASTPDRAMLNAACTAAGHIQHISCSQHRQHLPLHGGQGVLYLWAPGALSFHRHSLLVFPSGHTSGPHRCALLLLSSLLQSFRI